MLELPCVWKVLVMDVVGKRIISPILRVNDLREHGVTLYLYHIDVERLCILCRPLEEDRDRLEDVPAVYFVEPTSENISRICQVRYPHLPCVGHQSRAVRRVLPELYLHAQS